MDLNVFATLTSYSCVIDTDSQQPQYTKSIRELSPLMAAAANASDATLKILLDAGAKFDDKDILGDAALIYLCREETTELHRHINNYLISDRKEKCLDELFSKGVDPDVRGSKGMTALMYCAKNGNSKYIQKFSSKGFDMKIKCDKGRTALMYASFHNGNFPNFALDPLLTDSEINAADIKGNTALFYSMKHNQIGLFNAILKKSPNLNVQNKRKTNALMQAVISENKELLSTLLKHNPLLNEKDQHGNTALIMALTNNKKFDVEYKCAELLVAERGIDLDVQNNNGETAFMKAVLTSNLKLVQILTNAGANVSILDKNGKSALSHTRLLSPSSSDTVKNIIKHLRDVEAKNANVESEANK